LQSAANRRRGAGNPDIVDALPGWRRKGPARFPHGVNGFRTGISANIARITEVVEPEVKAMGFELVRVILFGKSEVGDEEHTLQIMAEAARPASW
jgi:hypothetical protein